MVAQDCQPPSIQDWSMTQAPGRPSRFCRGASLAVALESRPRLWPRDFSVRPKTLKRKKFFERAFKKSLESLESLTLWLKRTSLESRILYKRFLRIYIYICILIYILPFSYILFSLKGRDSSDSGDFFAENGFPRGLEAIEEPRLSSDSSRRTATEICFQQARPSYEQGDPACLGNRGLSPEPIRETAPAPRRGSAWTADGAGDAVSGPQ